MSCKAIYATAACAIYLVLASGATALGADGQLIVELKPESTDLLLEPGKSIDVSIRVRDLDGIGVPGLKLQLDATRGTLSGLQDLGDGKYQATYRMPAKRHPQAVILAAKASGAPPGWAVLKLRSKVDLPVTTTKPRVNVTLELGKKKFGPMRSDSNGRVRIPVIVGPGETEGTVVAVDEFGNRKRRTVKIPIPAISGLAGFAERKRLAADGQDSTDIYLIAIDPNGSPAQKLNIVAYRKGGKLSPSRRLAPGLYRLRYTAPGRLDRSKITLTLADKRDPKLSRRKFRFELSAGRPAKLTVVAEPNRLFADGRSRSTFTITVTDKGGNSLESQAPVLTCPHGSLRPVTELGDGRYQARFLAPVQTTGKIICRTRLEVSGSEALVAETEIELQAPQPGRLEVYKSHPTLPMDGKAKAKIDISVWDKVGRPLEGVAVTAATAIGAVDPVTDDGGGHYHASYTAPRGEEATKVRILVTAGTGETAINDEVIIMLEGFEPPAPPAPWFSIGPFGTLTTNFGRMLYGGFMVEAVAKLPGLSDYLYLSLESGYRYGRSADKLENSSQTLKTEIEYAPLHLNVLFKPLPGAIATPVLGIGGGAEFVQWSIRDPGGTLERNHKILLGSQVTVGGEVNLGLGTLVLYLRYMYAFLSDDAGVEQPTGTTGSRIKGSVGGMDVSLGYRIDF